MLDKSLTPAFINTLAQSSDNIGDSPVGLRAFKLKALIEEAENLTDAIDRITNESNLNKGQAYIMSMSDNRFWNDEYCVVLPGTLKILSRIYGINMTQRSSIEKLYDIAYLWSDKTDKKPTIHDVNITLNEMWMSKSDLINN